MVPQDFYDQNKNSILDKLQRSAIGANACSWLESPADSAVRILHM